MKYKKSVFRSLCMVTQFGLNMLVPIALCVALGLLIDSKFDTCFVIPLIFIGMAAGGRNVYVMAMKIANDDNDKKETEKKSKK